MPISGSYFYPVVQAPNSSYPSTDLRQLATAPTSGSNLAKIFHSASSVYVTLEDGTIVDLGAAGGGDVTGSTNFFVDTQLDSRGVMTNTTGDLILSSSTGQITVSGNLKVTESATIANVLVTGSRIDSQTGELILSSSATSDVVVSGAMIMEASTSPSIYLGGKSTTDTAFLRVAGAVRVRNGANSAYATLQAGSVVANGLLQATSVMSADAQIRTSKDETFAFSDNANGNIGTGDTTFGRIEPNTQGYMGSLFDCTSGSFVVAAESGELILSSSVGSVVALSGGLKLQDVPTANLPAGTDNLSGTMFWASDVKSAVIYGPEGWTPVVTGSAVA